MTTASAQDLARDLGTRSTDPAATLSWAADRFAGGIAFASSFGAEDVVLIDLIARRELDLPIFTLDTGRMFEETYELIDRIRSHYGVKIDVLHPDGCAVADLTARSGFFSFRESLEARKECCRLRKVDPLRRHLRTLQAWVTGQRRDQSETRTRLEVVENDSAFGLVKLNPLAGWSEEQVWQYIREHDVPYNRLHDDGYPSIGCAPCTRAVLPGADPRSGRWWWESPDHKECGLHPAGVPRNGSSKNSPEASK